ncbi:MAG: hypothetical protein WAO35_19180, partial [Terriglobia bacterium]
TKPRHVPEGKPKVRPAVFAHLLDGILRGDTAHQFFAVLRLHDRPLDTLENAVDPDNGRHTNTNVQIRRFFRNHQLQ